MAKLFDKLFNKKQKVAEKADIPAPVVLPRPKYDFVEQYTIVDPKRVLNGGYELFSGCSTIPVVCEESEVSPCGFRRCIQLPTRIVYGFLETLKDMPAEKITDPKMRTISIVHLAKGCRIVIGPNFESPKNPIFWIVDKSDKKPDWFLYVTPEKNRAIVEQLKIHTR